MLPLLWLCAIAAGASAEIFNLDDSAPRLRSNGQAVVWSGGWDALVVADSSCTRANARGVYAKPSHWTQRQGLAGLGWASAACMPDDSGALCVAQFGSLFPQGAPRYNASGAWGGAGCSRENDGRVLDPAHGYDVSACDVLDGGGDVAVCGRVAFFRKTAVSTWAYWLMCLLAVFVVRSLSYLVVQRVQPSAPAGGWCSDWVTVAACVAVLPLALAPDGDAGFITVEERFFFGVVCCYEAAYAVLFAYRRLLWGGDDDVGGGRLHDPPIYNLIAAALQIVACRLYLSAETPYNPVILWAVMTRALLKLRNPKASFAVSVTTFADSLVLSLMGVLGFGYNQLYLSALFTLAMATSDAVAGVGQ
jgi:hypothetical protein